MKPVTLKYLPNHLSICPGRERWSSPFWESVTSHHSQFCQACSPLRLWQVVPCPSPFLLPERGFLLYPDDSLGRQDGLHILSHLGFPSALSFTSFWQDLAEATTTTTTFL